MANELSGKKVAVLATDGYEQVELTEPVRALKEAGASVSIVSIKSGTIQGFKHDEKGDSVAVDQTLDEAKAESFDALVLPGGVMNPDTLRMTEKAVVFTKHFVQSGKPIAAICHGPWTLIDAEGVRGRRMTSWPSLKTDLRNAGAQWEDSEVVTDQGLVTSRNPGDIPAFCRKMIEEFREGRHERRGANDQGASRAAG
ncbi:type 1 glutamine amidotransferase [Roseomonas stagni]|uniref:Type 1 glutamine amidotransferase n=1 Tax=Falsiroseomonas algicola TaxID=2716930 RepID=A0A6M1LDK6_9PROT|nr:type 1 glutamine amidotransferase domain-containing protein [Falsiroseomonas algicola]NGM18385.1 type 1 glutamine amidotransferase [Falsiroseomonas algicola]